MPKRTLEELEASPKNVSYEELLAVLRSHGCTVREGTKHGAIAKCGGLVLTVPRPHGKHLLAVYVREAVRVLREQDR